MGEIERTAGHAAELWRLSKKAHILKHTRFDGFRAARRRLRCSLFPCRSLQLGSIFPDAIPAIVACIKVREP